MLVVLDSNILLRLVDRSDPLHPSTRRALQVLQQQGDRFCFFPQNAAEFWNVCTRPGTSRGGFGLSVEETDRRLRLLHRLFEVYHDAPAAYRHWHALVVDLRLTGVQVHDAWIVALMRTHGITRILTFDSEDFRRYGDIIALSPHELSG